MAKTEKKTKVNYKVVNGQYYYQNGKNWAGGYNSTDEILGVLKSCKLLNVELIEVTK